MDILRDERGLLRTLLASMAIWLVVFVMIRPVFEKYYPEGNLALGLILIVLLVWYLKRYVGIT